MTHTYAVLEVSPEIYSSIRAALVKAGYQHAFHQSCVSDNEVIDMHGVALTSRPRPHKRGDRVRCHDCGRPDGFHRGYGLPSLCEECFVLHEIRTTRASQQRSAVRRESQDQTRNVSCPECPRRFRTKRDLKVHHSTIHGAERDSRDREVAAQYRRLNPR